MLHSMVDAEDFKSGNEQKMDEQLLVRFFLKDREDKAETFKQGRPIFKEVEYVEIRVLGQRDPQACRPATHRDKKRFARHYDAFQKRVEVPETGTPLSQWPQISRSQVEEMSFLGVKTVENLIDMSDANAAKFRNGYSLKRLAKEWLAFSGETKAIAENIALKDRISELESRINAMMPDPNPAVQAANPQTNDAEPAPIVRRERKKAG